MKKVPSIRDYARKGINSLSEHDPWEITLRRSVNLQIALLKEVNPRVQLPKVRNLKIVPTNNLPWIASQEIVRLNDSEGANSTSTHEGMQFEYRAPATPRHCSFEQSRMDYALIYCDPAGGKIDIAFPKGVEPQEHKSPNSVASEAAIATRYPFVKQMAVRKPAAPNASAFGSFSHTLRLWEIPRRGVGHALIYCATERSKI